MEYRSRLSQGGEKTTLTFVTARLTEFKLNGHIGRWGGDEFVVAIPDCSETQAVDTGISIIQAISDSIQIESLKLNVGASIGISLAPIHSLSEQELIQFADIAMYKQKNSGETLPKVFSNELYLELREEEALREGLRNAIKHDEFFVVYQPILDCNNGSIASCEALLRWSFNGQLISPVVFIEICEQTGLIIDIGKWVLKQACEDAMKWKADGIPSQAQVSVNVSVIQLLEESFINFVDEALLASGLPPERLILEITESTFAENKSHIEQLLEKIKSRNIKISIDDFGTGYSSMSQLQSLPFDIIKIDRSFVHSLHKKGEAIIKATLFIAQELKCKTVAEGIETQQQAEQLRLLGANYLQGFLFAKPMRQSEVMLFINDFSTSSNLRAEA